MTMVNVTTTYQTGNEMILIRTDDDEDPTVYTREEAQEIKEQLDNII